MKVSVCMIVRDEEAQLERALRSIPRAYEIIVTDTGSTDRTKQIAEQLGAIVHTYSWNDDFAAARNTCSSHATGDYILALDADEVLPADTEEQVNAFIASYPNKAGCLYIQNVVGEERNRHRMVRFYPNNSDYSFRGFVHEQVYYFDEPADFVTLPILLSHYGYEDEQYKNKQKDDRYLPLYQKYLDQNPNDGYMLYQAGKLHYSLGRLEQAEFYLNRSKEVSQPSRLFFPVMIVMLGYILKEQGKSIEAERLLKSYEIVYPEFTDLYFLLGLLAMDTGNLAGVQVYFAKALEIGETTKYTSVEGVGSYKAAFNLGVFYEVTGQKEQAFNCYSYAGQFGYQPALDRLK